MSEPTDVPRAVSDYMKKIGSKGGAAGKGKAKKRSPEHYEKMIVSRNRKAKRRNKSCLSA